MVWGGGEGRGGEGVGVVLSELCVVYFYNIFLFVIAFVVDVRLFTYSTVGSIVLFDSSSTVWFDP